jgi:hypothetical protein
MPTPIDALHRWWEFYALIGGAAATLIGLMFVAASIGAGVFTSAHQAGIRSFLSPTVVHFSLVLVLCLVASAPIESVAALSASVIGVGTFGLGYSSAIWLRMRRHGLSATIDITDRLLYALLPIFVYPLVMAGGLAIAYHTGSAFGLLALAALSLLLVGIRNAWDMTVWIIDRRQP